MTVDDIKKRIEVIEEESGDPEVAHGMEDALWEDVLREIASGCQNPCILAAEALKTNELSFDRWYA